MVSSKSWPNARGNYYARSSVSGSFTDRYLAVGETGQALKMDFQTDSEKFWHKPSIENRRNTLCISRFPMGRIVAKEPLLRRKAIFRD